MCVIYIVINIGKLPQVHQKPEIKLHDGMLMQITSIYFYTHIPTFLVALEG